MLTNLFEVAVTLVTGMTTPETSQSTIDVDASTEVVSDQNSTVTAADMVSNISSMTSAYVNMSTMDTLQSTMNVTVSTDLVTDQGGTDMYNIYNTSEEMYVTTTASITIFNCSYPGQECLNGTCTSSGTCDCFDDFVGPRCEIYLQCPEDHCFQQGTENCTAYENGTYSCKCKQGYYGKYCKMFDGCMNEPCLNNGTCETKGSFGDYTCSCTTGDPRQNCLLNEENECNKNPPNSPISYITCVDQIGSRMLYCAPGYNGSECRDKVADDDYCLRHGCENSTYCKPLCNVDKCNETDVCRTFTALVHLKSTTHYDFTECAQKFANGYVEHECKAVNGLFDGFDGNHSALRDCSPFFDTVCTQSFADDICDPACDNKDCMHDGGDCTHPDENSSKKLPGVTVIKFAQPSMHKKQLETNLSLFSRSIVHVSFSVDLMQAGLGIVGSKFPDISVASKFFAAAIGKIPGLVDNVTDVYACPEGKYNNGSQSVCNENCSSTCKQEGKVCNWSNGTCLHGCQEGYWGEYCEKICAPECNGSCTQMEGYCTTCPDGKYGTSCLKDCDGNCTLSKCNISDGECECTAGKFWSRIHFKCVDCNVGCFGNRCEHGTGHCKCAVEYYGTSCAGRCSANCARRACNENGMCTVGCIAGYYGVMCNTKCASGCDGGTCSRTGECTGGCMAGYYGDMCDKRCASGCDGGTCSRTGECTGGCMAHYYGDMCDKKCASGCSGQTCSRTGMCTDGCTDGYYGDMCDKKCATGCAECRRDTGECITSPECKPGQGNCEEQEQEPEESNTGVIVAIVIAVIIVLLIILVAIICWRRKQSGDYIVEDEEEMHSPVMKATTLEVKTNADLQPVSPYMGRSTDMIDMDEKQVTVVYTGPAADSKIDLVDRNPDGKSTKSDDSKSSASSSDDEKKPKDGAADEEEPATGEGAPMGRKRSSLKITLSREKQPAGEMSPKSPQLIVINDKTGEVLSPLKIDNPEKSAFEMPDTPLKHTMAPLASEEDLLADIGPKPTENDQTSLPEADSEEKPLIDKDEDRKSKRSSSSSSGSEKRSSKRSSSSSEGKKSKKSRLASSSSSEPGSDLDEKISEYEENKEKITEM